MDKFFNSTFDALTNVVPGSCIIAILFFFDPNIENSDNLITKLNEIKLGSAAFLVFASYVIGFALTPLGKFLYLQLGTRIWSLKTMADTSGLSVTEKFVLVRQYSPANFKYVESWNMFCNLAHNLAVVSLFLLLASLYRAFVMVSHPKLFAGIAILSIGLFLVFLHRAVVFRNWALNDLDATVHKLALPEHQKQEGLNVSQ